MELQQFFIDQLRDIYWVEQKLVRVLPKLEKAAFADELKQAFSSHCEETKNHVSRLEKVFGILNTPVEGSKIPDIAGIADEGQNIIDESKDSTAERDVALIFVSQKAEHYEIATYGGLVQLARTLGYTDAAEILSVTLAEEKKADSLLTRIVNSLEIYSH